jgi:hypothetical protein
MSNQKPKGVGDVKITQKDVDNFFNSIHTDALVDSIKMSYKPTFKVKIIEEVPNYAPTWEDIEKDNITHHYTLEEEVNEFIRDKEVISIQYYSYPKKSVLITYKEYDNEKA